MKKCVVNVELYEHKVLGLITRDPDEVEAQLRKLNTSKSFLLSKGDREKITNGVGGLCWYGDRRWSVIWMGSVPKTPYQISILSHECLHATTQLLNMIGVPFSAANDEVFAYLLDFLVMGFLTKMRKK